MDSFLTLAHERYSCRKFDPRPVEAEKMHLLLEAAIAAPSAVDRQPWHAWVFQSAEACALMRAHTRFHFDAPAFVLFGALPAAAWTRKHDGQNYAGVDATIAATHFMLEAHSLGLGTTWVGVIDTPALKEALPELAEYELLALFPVGYPAADAKPSALHFKRKAEKELVSWL